MRKYRTALLVLLFGVLAGCASNETSPTSRSGSDDPAVSYKRSKPAAPVPPAMLQEVGFIQGNRLKLTLNETLISQQSYEQCDQRPVDVSPPWRMPRCTLFGLLGCREYESIPGQVAPACKINNSVGPCMMSEAPKPPPKRYETRRDCYQAKADPDVLGQIVVYAVPAQTPRSETILQGRRLGMFSLREGSTQDVPLPPNSVANNECLALADTRGRVINLRGTEQGPTNHLFSTPQQIADRQTVALRKQAAQKQEGVELWRRDVEKFTRELKANPAWQNDRCVAPPMAALPPEPIGLMSAATTELATKGYCITLLMARVDPAMVVQAAKAAQEFEFVEGAMVLKGNVLNAPVCTRRSHYYADSDVTRLLRESGKEGLNDPNLIIGIIKSIEGQMRDSGMTTQREQQLIVGMLNQCATNAIRSCEAPRRAWVDEVTRIKQAPSFALKSCESDLEQAKHAFISMKAMEKEAAAAPAPHTLRVEPERGPIALSAAACGG